MGWGTAAANVGMGVAAGAEQLASSTASNVSQAGAMAQMGEMAARAMEMELFKNKLEELKGLTKGVGTQSKDAGEAAKP